MTEVKYGFGPVCDGNSKVLILGSFPSVKSREIEFYYGNKQNRFWQMLCSYFGENIPESTSGKVEFLLRNRIALWDIVTECEIDGSKDSTIKNYKIAVLETVLNEAKIELVILNGGTAFSIFEKKYRDIMIPYLKLPSTSPANTHFDNELWVNALDRVFKGL